MHNSASSCRDQHHAEEHYLKILQLFEEYIRSIESVATQPNQQKPESFAYD